MFAIDTLEQNNTCWNGCYGGQKLPPMFFCGFWNSSFWCSLCFALFMLAFLFLLFKREREFQVTDFHWHNSMEVRLLSCMHHCCSWLCPRCLWLSRLHRIYLIPHFPVFHPHEITEVRNLCVLPQAGEHTWWITWAIKWMHLCEWCTQNILWEHSVIKAEKGNKNE